MLKLISIYNFFFIIFIFINYNIFTFKCYFIIFRFYSSVSLSNHCSDKLNNLREMKAIVKAVKIVILILIKSKVNFFPRNYSTQQRYGSTWTVNLIAQIKNKQNFGLNKFSKEGWSMLATRVKKIIRNSAFLMRSHSTIKPTALN